MDSSLPSSCEVLIVGAGLAGAAAAVALSQHYDVVVIDANGPVSGASGAAAGLVNPFMGQKAKASWGHEEALDAARQLALTAGVSFHATGIVRPAQSLAQAEIFQERANGHSGLAWLSAGASGERFPLVRAPHGALWVAQGGWVDLPSLVEGAIRESGCRTVGARLVSADLHFAITDTGQIAFEHLVLAPGYGCRQLALTSSLPLHPVKGQVIRVSAPDDLQPPHPPVAGRGYAVPTPDGVLIGSTFEHAFEHLHPDPAADPELLTKAERLVPALGDAEVMERRAGVRLTVPTSVSPRRLPLAGRLPGRTNVWLLAGFGAKGLMTAPLIASWLPDALTGNQTLPAELSVPTA